MTACGLLAVIGTWFAVSFTLCAAWCTVIITADRRHRSQSNHSPNHRKEHHP